VAANGVYVQLLEVAPENAVEFRSHWYVYEGTPPLTVDVKFTD
jgi:hypothetical protein